MSLSPFLSDVDQEEHRDLMELLVGEHTDLYYQSPEFHAWVHQQATTILATREMMVALHSEILKYRQISIDRLHAEQMLRSDDVSS